mmetsp:Transcript_15879/g.37006  ORF Transcript_15879/g.37006 Transcript_15879/m.37006 type:complete len:210 (+) Transcript_15879:3941-4570(+)
MVPVSPLLFRSIAVVSVGPRLGKRSPLSNQPHVVPNELPAVTDHSELALSERAETSVGTTSQSLFPYTWNPLLIFARPPSSLGIAPVILLSSSLKYDSSSTKLPSWLGMVPENELPVKTKYESCWLIRPNSVGIWAVNEFIWMSKTDVMPVHIPISVGNDPESLFDVKRPYPSTLVHCSFVSIPSWVGTIPVKEFLPMSIMLTSVSRPN